MQVTITNTTSAPLPLNWAYKTLAPNGETGDSITVSRTTTELQSEGQFRIQVENGDVTLAFAVEAGDSAAVGSPHTLETFADAGSLPAAADRPLFTAVWQADNATVVWTDGTNWKLASGVTTS